jgi:predicted GNAT family N-acyltransferase
MASELSLKIEKLRTAHQKSEFDCGNQDLNDFLHKYAAQNERKGISTTYVATHKGETKVLAYYSISSGQVSCETLPESTRRKLPRYPIPVVKLGRLATDIQVQNRGIGRIILVDALERILMLSSELGMFAVEVDAKSSKAKRFYLKMGFEPLVDDEYHLYLPFNTVRKLFT